MKQIKITAICILVMVCLLLPNYTEAQKKKTEPLIQLAILLDTSSSMQGLIEQAKTQLWKIVNEMALAKQNGRSPRLQVALYEYGKSSIPAAEKYLRMIVPLSEDLDLISEELFKLRTAGGSEYCGEVIQTAVESLKWTKKNDILKVMFIAGNEPFTQGVMDYKKACKNSISKGIIVNTIFCGNYGTGVNTSWKDGADRADGKYMNIDHNMKVRHIEAPQDKEISELGSKLNSTYIAYGREGFAKKERQESQDVNAAGMSKSVMVQRSVAKASKQYNNSAWDIVDAEKNGKVKVEEMDEAELPAEMKKMDKKQRRKYVEDKKKEREKIQKRIKDLRSKRDKYVAEQRKKNTDDNTLDAVIIKTIRTQAEKKKYKFKK